MDTTAAEVLIEDEVWKAEIKEELFPALTEGFPHVKWLTGDFPTGDTLTIPSTGRMSVRTYTENTEITVEDPSLSEIQLTINKYYQSGIGVTDKFKQDSYIATMSIATWRSDMLRAMKEKIEADMFNTLHTDTVNGQTAADDNDISANGSPTLDHRWGASGTSGIFSFDDMRHAKYVFDKHNVAKNDRVFCVDPKVSHDLLAVTGSNASDIIRQDVYGPNSAIREGWGLGMGLGRFYGFWVFETNLLPTVDTETVPKYGTTTTIALTSPVVNQAFGQDALMAAFRQNIETEQFRDHNKKRDVYHLCVRFGNRVYRKESVIAVLSV